MRAVISHDDKQVMSKDQLMAAQTILRDLKAGNEVHGGSTKSTAYSGHTYGHTWDVLVVVKNPTSGRKHFRSTLTVDRLMVIALDGSEWSPSRILCYAIRTGKVDQHLPPWARQPSTLARPAQPTKPDPKPDPPPPPPAGIYVSQDGKTVSVFGIDLPRYPSPGPLTPTADEVERPVGMDTHLKVIAAALSKCRAVLLEGDSGTGKTTILTYLAHLCNANLVKVVGDPEYGPSLWLGHLHAKDGTTYWVDGDLPTAMKGVEGNGQTWLFIDELSRMLPDNASPALPVLERRGGRHGKLRLTDQPDPDKKIVESHPDFRIVMAMNPFDGDFAGTHEVDLALLRRASVRIEIDYPDPHHQRALLRRKFPAIPRVTVNKVVECAAKLREERRQRRISFPCSPDVLEALLDMSEDIGMELAAQVTIINKATSADRPRVRDICDGLA